MQRLASCRPLLVVVTFLLELPFDLGVDEGCTLDAYERADEVVAPVFDPLQPTPAGLAVDTRFVFRRSPARMSPARTIALDVFEDFWDGVDFVDSSPAASEARRRVPITVVAAMTAMTTTEQDSRVPDHDLVRRFDKTLGQLNELLTMLGFCLGSAAVGAVRRTELPARVPVVLDLVHHRPRRQVEVSVLELHSFEEPSPVTADDVLLAHDLAFRDRLADWPFRPVVVLLHRAHRDQLAGEHDQAVIALVTATELMVEAVIEATLRSDDKEARIERVLQAGLTNLVRDHLAPLLERLGGDSDLAGRWLEDCYQLRKRVAHEGHVPAADETRTALDITFELAGEIGDVLRASDRLWVTGQQLPASRS